MIILVTGANGYIGSNVIKSLLDLNDNNKIIALDFNHNNLDSRTENISFDILSKAKDPELYNKLKKPDVCIHLAWQDGFNHNADSHIDNISSHYHFLKNMINSGCKNISVMGSMHEIGYYEGEVTDNTPCCPLSLYGIAKNALRQSISLYADSQNVSLKWLRAFYILGNDAKNKSIFSKIIQLEKEGKESFPFTDGQNKYDFIDINLLAKQIAKSSLQREINGIINCSSGVPVSLKDKVEEFIKNNNFKIRPQYGAFPNRSYDSPAIWGGDDKIKKIMENKGKNI